LDISKPVDTLVWNKAIKSLEVFKDVKPCLEAALENVATANLEGSFYAELLALGPAPRIALTNYLNDKTRPRIPLVDATIYGPEISRL
jgi:hypothetical protein